MNNPVNAKDPSGNFAIVDDVLLLLLIWLATVTAAAVAAASTVVKPPSWSSSKPKESTNRRLIDVIKDAVRPMSPPLKPKPIFPANPLEFKPRGLILADPIITKKNGTILQWRTPDGTTIFEWDENPYGPAKDGPHYHIKISPDQSTKLEKGGYEQFGLENHYYPGSFVPDPYATIFF